MRAEYDSEADALSIDLIEAPYWEGADPIDGDFCTIALSEGRAANVELLAPREHLGLLERAAEKHGLDREALRAAAESALAAPDRVVVVEVLTGA